MGAPRETENWKFLDHAWTCSLTEPGEELEAEPHSTKGNDKSHIAPGLLRKRL